MCTVTARQSQHYLTVCLKLLPDPPIAAAWCRAAARHPLVHTVVRYDMRGVGLSQGSKSLWGRGDCQDVPTVCKGVLKAVGNHANLSVVG